MSESPAPISAFLPTGDRLGDGLVDVERAGLRPALFTARRDLSKLRHDFPLVLLDGDAEGAFVRSLSDIVDGVLREIAPRGIEGERPRTQVLGLEREIRTLVMRGRKGSLLQLWDLAEANLLCRTAEERRKALSESLSLARGALNLDGEVIDCDEETPAKVLSQAWPRVEGDKVRRFRERVDELVLKLSNILKADAVRSVAALEADALKRSVGTADESVFDFDTLSGILRGGLVNGALPESRRRRIRATISTLDAQRFYPDAAGDTTQQRRQPPHLFLFDRCAAALEAFRERLPEMVELIKTMSVAQLEIANRYREAAHDPVFESFDERFVEPDDLALFPSYLVCLRGGAEAQRNGRSSPRPWPRACRSRSCVKATTSSRSCRSPPAGSPSASGAHSSRPWRSASTPPSCCSPPAPASMACASRSCAGWRATVRPLFSVFSGAAGVASGAAKNAPDLPPYLKAAAATESRAFPAFAYDPGAGDDWAARFSLDGNPQTEVAWPTHPFDYEDDELQRQAEDLAFTFVDFVACDGRYAGRIAEVPRARWHDGMIPLGAYLDLEPTAAADKLPYILMVDAHDDLHRVVVDVMLVDAARRCRAMWHNLRELAGLDNARSEQSERSEPVAAAPEAPAETTATTVEAAPADTEAAEQAPLASPTSRRRAAPPATSAPRSTTRCSPTMTISWPTSPTRMRAPSGSWWRRPRAARSASSTRASRETRASRGSTIWSPGPSRSIRSRRGKDSRGCIAQAAS